MMMFHWQYHIHQEEGEGVKNTFNIVMNELNSRRYVAKGFAIVFSYYIFLSFIIASNRFFVVRYRR